MKNPMESPRSAKEDPQDMQIKEMVRIIKASALSADDLFHAYQISMGIDPQDTSVDTLIREEVYSLAESMKQYMKDGLAVNRIVELISVKRDYDRAPEYYNMLIDALLISDKEKDVLKSIVTRKRAGTLVITDQETGAIDELKIDEGIADIAYTHSEMAATLMLHLSEYRGKRIEITFSE